MKKGIVLCLVAAILSVTSVYAAAPKKKTSEKKDTTAASKPAAKPKLNTYQKFMKDVVDSTSGDFALFYKAKDGKLFMELSKEKLGKAILMGSTVKGVSNAARVNIGYKYADPVTVLFQLEDSTVVVTKPGGGASLSTPEEGLAKAIERNYIPKVLKRIPVKTLPADSASVIFDISELVKDMAPRGGVIKAKSKDACLSIGKVKSFEDNASVELTENVSFSQEGLFGSTNMGEGTIKSEVSFLLLPEKPMNPRLRDSRVGVFGTHDVDSKLLFYDLRTNEDGMRPYMLANRWRLEPSDTAAWLAGKMVPVTKPIVWYIDDSFPESWRKPIKDGVLAWNAAFEKIGLKGVMEARDFPTPEEDPEFDPDNLKYSCIRFVPNATMNAMGPSWTDPRTGEILNASVLVYNDVIRLINNWRFVLTAQVDERVRTKKMPQDVIDESMVYVISHEIGHTLGLMHNMGASSAYPVEKLRDPEFTAKYGTTPSIMDYARFNYVAQPGDKGVKLTPPDLGVYDYYAIEWLYKPVIGAKDMWEESAIAEKLVDEHAGDPMYRYGPQQPGVLTYVILDPSALTEDLGDDPIKASDYGIANLKYILPNINSWIRDDADFTHRKNLYTRVYMQYYTYLQNVIYQIGGIYFNEVKEGTCDLKPSMPVDRDVQKASVKWLLDQTADMSWINEPSLTDQFDFHVDIAPVLAGDIGHRLASYIPQNIVFSAHIAGEEDAYTLREYFDDVYEGLFASRSGRLTQEEKTRQNAFVQISGRLLPTAPKGRSLDDGSPLLSDGDGWLLQAASGEGFCHCCDGTDSFGEAKPYFRQVPVREMNSISELTPYREEIMKKICSLAKRRSKSGIAADRAHYTSIYIACKMALGE